MHELPGRDPTQKAPLPALTSIRFFAALWVVVFHLQAAGFSTGGEASNTGWLHNLLSTGYCGVGLFFVLSGFILTYNYLTLDTHGRRLQHYWVARAARILPLYFFGLALDSPSVIAGTLKTGVTPANIAWIAGVLLACVLLMQAWYGTGRDGRFPTKRSSMRCSPMPCVPSAAVRPGCYWYCCLCFR
jgi:peptidoglycan/LPS O-acetylase OafA/YrhL